MSDLYDLIVAIEKYKPLYEKRLTVPCGTGFGEISYSVLGKYAEYTSNQLAFPVLSFLIKQHYGSYYASKTNNSLDPIGYKALNRGDTLAIQESVVLYEK